MMNKPIIFSFGFRHGAPTPMTDHAVVIDVRTVIPKNPYHNRKLRYLRGDHPDVIADIRKTPLLEVGYEKILNRIQAANATEIWLGCTGGHHRSVYFANRLATDLNGTVKHRDYDKK